MSIREIEHNSFNRFLLQDAVTKAIHGKGLAEMLEEMNQLAGHDCHLGPESGCDCVTYLAKVGKENEAVDNTVTYSDEAEDERDREHQNEIMGGLNH
jgi:hypothetical protein